MSSAEIVMWIVVFTAIFTFIINLVFWQVTKALEKRKRNPKPPPEIRGASLWYIAQCLWHLRRNNRISARRYGRGETSAFERCEEIDFFENRMYEIFLEVYKRFMGRDYDVMEKRVK